jgi:hypothetical protein
VWQAECGSDDDAAEWFRNGCAAIPYSLVLPFVWAEFEEKRRRYDAAGESLQIAVYHVRNSTYIA